MDSLGRIYNVYFPGTKDVYGAGYKLVYVPVLNGGTRPLTFYTRHGDWFGWGCVILSVLALTRVIMANRKSSRAEPAVETSVA